MSLQVFKPPRDKTNKMACAPSEDSDQPGHPPSLIRVFAVRMKNAWFLSYPLSGCPGWSEYSLGAHAILLVLSWGGSFICYCVYIELEQDKTNKMTCAPREDLDQSAHARCLIRVSLGTLWIAKDPMFLQADNEDSNQTGQMPRMIWDFVGRTCPFVGFVLLRLFYYLVGSPVLRNPMADSYWHKYLHPWEVGSDEILRNEQ